MNTTEQYFHSAQFMYFTFTTPLNNMWTLKFKAHPTNAFFATVNEMSGGSSQLPSTAESAVIKSNRWAQFKQRSGRFKEPTNICLTVAKNASVGWALNFRFRVLLKDALIKCSCCILALLEMSVHFFNRCMSRMLCCQHNHCLLSGIDIFIFLCCILNQIEDGVPTFSKEIIQFLLPRKTAESTCAPLVHPQAVFLELKHAEYRISSSIW